MRKVCGSRAKVGLPGDQQREGDSDVPLVVIKQELSEVTLLGLGVRLREDGLGCGDERCCFRRKRGDSEGDLLFGDLKMNVGCEFLTHKIG